MQYYIPKTIKSHLTSARSLVEDADSLDGDSRHNATRYFLYIKAWELFRIANDLFGEWAHTKVLDNKLLKDHSYKLDGSPNIEFIEIKEGRAIVTPHGSGDEKSRLLQSLLYGSDEKSRTEIFERGWFFDTFRNELIGKIKLLEVTLKGLEKP